MAGEKRNFSADIKNVEIFKVGRWFNSAGEQSIDGAYLDSMVASWAALSSTGGFIPHLKLGHDDVQAFLGQTNGLPSLGFITNLRREGDSLYADFSNVPDVVIEMIKNRRYGQRSIEVMPEIEFNGMTYQNVLAGVALLGADLPAVKGLEDLATLMFTEAKSSTTQFKENPSMTVQYSQEQHDQLTAVAVTAARTEETAKFQGQINQLTADNAALKTSLETATKRADTAEASLRATKFEAMIDKAISEGRVLPKEKETVLIFANALPEIVKTSTGEKTNFDLLKEHLETRPKTVDFSQNTTDNNGNGGEQVKGQTVSDVLHAKTQEKVTASAGKLSYADARQAVISENKELADKYAANPGALAA